jgi:periplasmic divalent cation tolerance protein
MKEYIVVLSTCPQDMAGQMARALVESKKCAGVNIVEGIRSIYWWKGDMQDETESLLLMKTETSLIDALWGTLKRTHPYEVPEFLALPVKWGGSLIWTGYRAS